MANRALLIGINAYPGAPLKGCVNDVQEWANLLTSRYGFKPAEVRLLTDARAVTKEWWPRLNWMLAGAGPGDKMVFCYSGHGAQIATRDGHTHEVDGLDEIVCPADFDWNRKHMITDDQLHRLFMTKVKKGVLFNWIADCCHSGDLTRNLPAPPGSSESEYVMPRVHPTPVDIKWRENVLRSTGRYRPRPLASQRMNVGFVSGCRSEQTSADAWIKGRPCGVLSHFLKEVLKRRPKRTPLVKLVQETTKLITRARYPQRPVVSGARKNRPFLG